MRERRRCEAAGDEVECEDEGEGDAEVVLGHGVALVGGVGLVCFRHAFLLAES